MEEWKEYRLNDVCEVINGRAYKQEELLEEGKYRVLRVGNIFQGNNWYYSDIELPEDKYCYNGDLLYAWSCGFAPYIWKGEKTIYHYHIWKLKENKEVVDRKFLYFYLIVNTKRFLGGTHGSVMLHLTKKEMEEQLLKLPSLKTQRKIASILSSLDDKIGLNRKINANLEAQAQALFKSWFVDFEPFKDQPFVESELGMIPEGWRVGTLGELIDIKYGKDHKKLLEGCYPVYGSGGLMRYAEKAIYSGESVLIPRKGTLNNVMYVNEAFWTVDTMFFSIPRVEKVMLFVYIFLCNRDLSSLNAGSAVPSMTTEILNNMKIIIPSQKILNSFNDIASTLYSSIKQQQQESRRLASLRDTLLPRLMSGELKVNEIVL